jgi:hypothetical protein
MNVCYVDSGPSVPSKAGRDVCSQLPWMAMNAGITPSIQLGHHYDGSVATWMLTNNVSKWTRG